MYCNIIMIYIFPCAYVHAQFAMIVMHKRNTLRRASGSVLVFSEQNCLFSQIIIVSGIVYHLGMTVTQWNMYGHKKGCGIARFVCELTYKLDS